jgi:hypothetical protein
VTPSPQATQGKLFSGVFTLIPIHLLRQLDRKLPAKPWQTEQASLFPTAIDFSADETVANGTDKSVPYKGAP